jgi:hypothetical protein
MYARVSRFEGLNEVSPELGQEIGARVTPILESMTGWQGGLQLIDPAGRRVLTISLFDTEENMQAAEPTFEELPERLGDLRERLGGERVTVERYVVAQSRFPQS